MKSLIIALAFCFIFHTQVVRAASEPWQKLTPTEQQALIPVYPLWNTLPEAQQQNLKRLAQHYHDLDPKAKQRFESRLATWAKLTPEQRQAAREKYHAYTQLPHEKREQVKQIVKQNQAIKAQQQPASGTPVAPVMTPVPPPSKP
jgi:hypothetical protein